jgi:GTPase SAR1 family protein
MGNAASTSSQTKQPKTITTAPAMPIVAKPFSKSSTAADVVPQDRLCAVVLGAAKVGKSALCSRFASGRVPFQDSSSESSSCDDFGSDTLGASSIEEDAAWEEADTEKLTKRTKGRIHRNCVVNDPQLAAKSSVPAHLQHGPDFRPRMTIYDTKGPRGGASGGSVIVDDRARRLLASRAGCVVVYAVHRRESFEFAERVLAEVAKILKESGRQTPGMLVANKAEKREPKHKVTREEGEELAARYGCGFIATSATSHGHFSSPNSGGFGGSPKECAEAELEELRIENEHCASVFVSLLTRHRAGQFIGTSSETKSANFGK